MTLELVTGKAGAPHIDGNDIGTINQAMRGTGSYVLEFGDNLTARVTGSNTVQIGTGCASMEGRDIIISAPETVTITSGSQGMKRNDLICMHYHSDGSTGVETTNLVVLKGTAVSSNPADPNVPGGTIMGGSIDAYWKLYRVPLDGITMGTPIQLFAKLPSIKTMGDSITQLKTLYENTNWHIHVLGYTVQIRVGSLAFGGGSWDSVTCPYIIPSEYRPGRQQDTQVNVANGLVSRMLIVQADGKIRVANMGGAGSTNTCSGTLTYIIGA